MNKALYTFVISALALVSATAQETGKKKITNDSFKLPQWGGYRLSPDNSRVAFTKRERDEEGELTPAHIFVYDLSTRRTMQLTNSDKGESGIQWLSDNEILFRSDRDGDSKWWTISLHGGEGVALFDDEDARTSGTLSKDRTKVVYNKRTDRPDKEEWEKKVEDKDDGYYADLPADTFNHIWVYDSETKEHK